ncbi:MAG: hypothetical protein Q9219_005191 [cf. Caloplaca sp. 3 TL-2023]
MQANPFPPPPSQPLEPLHNYADLHGAESGKLERPGAEEGAKGVKGEDCEREDRQKMPGLLKSARNDGRELELSQAHTTDNKTKKRAPDDNRDYLTHSANGTWDGTHAKQVNGNSVTSDAARVKPTVTMESASRQLPPEIEHITFGYLPLSQLITRLVQDTFNGLTECVNDLSDLPLPSLQGEETANAMHVNRQKKLRLLNFAHDRRSQFIKILVLSQWSRQIESIGKVIDLRIWLENQRRLYDDACDWMGELKRIMQSERMPNPDLRTALEALSLGKAPGLPDLGYLPPQPLSPQQLFKVLRRINTQLSLRLHLHETIPPAFRDYSVANGRATFRVPDEFEVDLSIANDDPSSQLYLIDFRLLFFPTLAKLPQGHLRGELEHRVNEVLSRDGLSGCYSFLHEFVLSHKINIFRHQAYRLSQEGWSEHLKVEAVHRSLIVQYWVSRPGGKNWVEIGIFRRETRRSSWLDKEMLKSHIGIRCFRSGKETCDVPINLSLRDLSVEAILKQVISAHTDFILREIAARLKESHLYGKNLLRLRRTRNVAEPIKSHLSIQLTQAQRCTVIQEPSSGKLALLPASSLNSKVERELNNLASPEKGAPSRIAQLRAITVCDEIERTLQVHGWEITNSRKPNQDNLKQHFGKHTLKATFFRKGSWRGQWLLAFTASLEGDAWWILELNDNPLETISTAPLGPSIRIAFRLPSSNDGAFVRELSIADLSRIEHKAAGLISQFTDSRQLSIQNFPHKLVSRTPNRSRSDFPGLYVYFPDQRAQRVQISSNSTTTPWSSQSIRISFMGINAPHSLATHLVVAQRGSTTLGSQSWNSFIGELIKVHPTSGAFAFQLCTPVGQSTIPATLDRLASVQRLIDHVSTLQAFGLQAERLSLDQIQFIYATKPSDCRMRISFVGDDAPRLCLDKGSPHLRIQDQLALLFRDADGLNQVICFLQLTLPLMHAFTAVEAAHSDNKMIILPRSVSWYHFRYQNPPARFDVRLRKRRGDLMWFVQQLSPEKTEKENKAIQDQLDSIVKGNGEGWLGVKPGIAVTIGGVEAFLKKVDEIFQQVLPAELASPSEKKDFKGQKRKAEASDVVVLE